jgi:hypothetical protein
MESILGFYISNLVKNPRFGPESFYAVGQTERQTSLTKPIVSYCSFAKEPENGRKISENETGVK